MALIRAAYPRPRATMLGQLGLSVTATVVATLIVSGIQREFASLRPASPMPQLTSGGKFAARVEALRAAADDADAGADVPTPPRVPLLVADAALQTLPIAFAREADPAAARPAVEATKPAKRIARGDGRHPAVAAAAIDVLPPRRSDNVVVAVSVPTPAEPSAMQGVWTATKGLYRQAVWLGGDVIDRVNPLNLLP